MRWLALLISGCSVASAADPVTQALTSRYRTMRLNLIESAEAMAEDQYSFKLTPGQRSFSEWIHHTAEGNWSLCAAMLGAAPPARLRLIIGRLSVKDVASREIKESFDYCDKAFAAMADAKIIVPITVGSKQRTPVDAMVALVAALNEHYGNLVGYLRAQGITPPSTARARQKAP